MRRNFHNFRVIASPRMKIFAAVFILMLFVFYCNVEARTSHRQHDGPPLHLRPIDEPANAFSSVQSSSAKRKTNVLSGSNNNSTNRSSRLNYGTSTSYGSSNGNQNRNLNTWQTANSVGTDNRSPGASIPSLEWEPVPRYHNSDRGYHVPPQSTAAGGRDPVLRDAEDFDGWEGRNSNPEPTTTTTSAPIGTTRGRNHNKSHDGRHICMQHKTIHVPVKTTEVYTRPTWKQVSEPCQKNHMCTRVQLVNEPAVRDVIRHKITKQVTYSCCPGWEQLTKNANGCMKPICKNKCRNGGACFKPDTCSCPAGFTGSYCEKDINECKEDKPCDQFCYNTEGSYYCKCREGFILLADRQSCKKIGGTDDAFEARELENDIDTEEVNSRLHKLEKTIANEQATTNELHKNIQTASYQIDSLKTRLNVLEHRQQDISSLQNRLVLQDEKTKKLEHLINVLFKCKSHPHSFCP